MNRRTVFVGLAGLVGVAVLIKVMPRKTLSLEECVRNLQDLKGKAIAGRGAWKPYRVFTHIAQSIEFSMSAFPQMKPKVFQDTVGSLAFSLFSIAGAMKHSLSEPIPGAPEIEEEGDAQAALDRVLNSLQQFSAYEGPMAPHFAYGNLSKADYQNAHIMHINQHLTEIYAA